jgi:hypothetical protein
MMTTGLVEAGVVATKTKVTFEKSADLPKGWQPGIAGSAPFLETNKNRINL